MVLVSRSWPWVVASQERGNLTGLPVVEVEVVVLGAVVVAAVLSSKEVVATAQVGAVLPHDLAIAIAEVVPLGVMDRPMRSRSDRPS